MEVRKGDLLELQIMLIYEKPCSCSVPETSTILTEAKSSFSPKMLHLSPNNVPLIFFVSFVQINCFMCHYDCTNAFLEFERVPLVLQVHHF